MTRVLLIDDHSSFRQSLAFILEREPEMQVVGQAGTVAEARKLVQGIDVAVVDLHLPDGNGLEVIPLLRDANPDGGVLLLTASVDRVELARGLEAGAAGVINKTAGIVEIVDAVKRVSQGEHLHSPREIIELLHAAGEQREENRQATMALSSLTPRENEVLCLLAEGLTDKEIARRMGLSHETVRTHMLNVLGKLGVNSRLQAVIFAVRYGHIRL